MSSATNGDQAEELCEQPCMLHSSCSSQLRASEIGLHIPDRTSATTQSTTKNQHIPNVHDAQHEHEKKRRWRPDRMATTSQLHKATTTIHQNWPHLLVHIGRGQRVKDLLLLVLRRRSSAYSNWSLCVTLTIVMCTYMRYPEYTNKEESTQLPHSELFSSLGLCQNLVSLCFTQNYTLPRLHLELIMRKTNIMYNITPSTP